MEYARLLELYEDDVVNTIRLAYGYELDLDRMYDVLEVLDANPRASVVVKGVTGSGKTNVPKVLTVLDVLRFVNERRGIPHLFYSQPTESLTNAKAIEFERLSGALGDVSGFAPGVVSIYSLRPKRPFSDVVISTYDFTLAYFLGRFNLLGRKRQGIFPFGWHVYDEIHVFSPGQMQKIALLAMNYPKNVIISATLSSSVEGFLRRNVGADVAVLEPFRERRVRLRDIIPLAGGESIIDFILSSVDLDDLRRGKYLVVLNTATLAERLALEVLKRFGLDNVSIAELRNGALFEVAEGVKVAFLTSSTSLGARERLERVIELDDSIRLVIATQVAEIGLNYDPDVVITEIAPPDSLIQRVGRIRTGGEVVVFYDAGRIDESHTYTVYPADVVRRTLDALGTFNIERVVNDIEESTGFIDSIMDATVNWGGQMRSVIRNIRKSGLLGQSEIILQNLSRLRDTMYIYVFDYNSWTRYGGDVRDHLYRASYDPRDLSAGNVIFREVRSKYGNKEVKYESISELLAAGDDVEALINSPKTKRFRELLRENVGAYVIIDCE